MSPKVLHIWNVGAANTCGIRNFGEQLSTALRRAGAEVTDVDGDYPTVYREGYLPVDMSPYDVVHLNWHPATLNHYVPVVLESVTRSRALLSGYLHDLPPHSSCPFLPSLDVVVSAEPYPHLHGQTPLVLPYPIIDWVTGLPAPNPQFTVGCTGVRGDGLAELTELCERRGWTLNASIPGLWLAIDAEVRRLARSTVNVCWYHEERGLASAPSMCLGSGRPLLVNGSAMLRHLRHPLVYQSTTTLEAALVYHHAWWTQGGAVGSMFSLDLPQVPLSWTAAAEQLLHTWEAARVR